MRRLRLTLLILIILAFPALAQDAPPPDVSDATVTEVAQIDRLTGPTNTSAHLSPDGERILYINADAFCMLTLDGTEEACYSASEATGLSEPDSTPDHDSVTWSPDSSFVAFTTNPWNRAEDGDIWLFAANTGQFTNLTDDGYEGSILRVADDIPDTVFIDYAPAWTPDGTLTFARNNGDRRGPTQLWSLRLGDAEPVKLADLHFTTEKIGTPLSMEWSPDGKTLLYTLQQPGGQGGVWLYDAASGQTEMLLPDDWQERGNALSATFSPDGSQILLLTDERDLFMTDRLRDGHFIVDFETGEPTRLDPDIWVMSAGWLPDGSGLIYSGRSADYTEQGVYVSGDPLKAGRLVLTGTLGEDEAPYNVYAPTDLVRSPLRVAPNGTMLLGTGVAQALIVTRVEGFGPIPVQAQATDLQLVTDEPRITVAPPATETPVIEAGAQNTGAFTTVQEVARLPFPSGSRSSSSHLLPDGETLINAQQNVFCEYTLEAEELWCVEATYNDGEQDRPVRVDQETVTMSPDGRYLAFATDGMRLFRDPDIWVVDLETQQYANLTDDGYDGPMGSMDESSGTAHVDLVPAWRPDGMLTFARHSPAFNDAVPSLWMVDPAGGEPEKLADFVMTFDAFNLVIDMDWSPDGNRMAFVLDSQANSNGGLWLYEPETGDMRPLVVPPEGEGYGSAEFSPDSQSILLQAVTHAAARVSPEPAAAEDNGYFAVSLDGSVQKLQAPLFIMNAGWLSDGSLLYLLFDQEAHSSSGIFTARSASEMAETGLSFPTLPDDDDKLLMYGPTPDQWSMIQVAHNGRFVLGTSQNITVVMEAVAR